MAESELHKRARRLLQRGDRVGQPFGEALVAVDTDARGVRIKDGPAKGKAVDAFVEAPEGYRVGLEFHYRHKVGAAKIALLKEDGRYPVLEIDLFQGLNDASDDELRQYIVGWPGSHRFTRRWLYLPSMYDIERQVAPERLEALGWIQNHARIDERGMSSAELEELWAKDRWASDVLDNTSRFGWLKCCVPGCNGKPSRGSQTVESYETLPRFACSDHIMHTELLTHPDGVRAYKEAFPRIASDVVQGQRVDQSGQPGDGR